MTNDGTETTGWLGTLFEGVRLYNDTRTANNAAPVQTAAPATSFADSPALKYGLIGGGILLAILLLRKS